MNSSRTRPRPALVLSTRGFNGANGHSVLAMVTRATHTRWPSDHEIVEHGPTGLHSRSVIRFKIFTLDNRLLQRPISRLSDRDARACGGTLATSLGHWG